jgi:putative ABC transport system permease protein
MHALLQDLGYGLRIMRNSPGFTAVALIVLALGIGGNTAIFSVVNGVLLHPLPYPQADQLVSIRSAEPSRGIPPVVASYADYLDWKQQAHSFSNMGTYVSDAFNLSAGGQSTQVESMNATTSALQTLGIAPELGRIFTPDAEQWGNRHVVLLTHALWKDKFGANPDIVGRTVRLDAEPYVVIGVMPENFAALIPRMQICVPFAMRPGNQVSRGERWVHVIARMNPGVSIATAQQELQAIQDRLAQSYEEDRGVVNSVISAREQLVGNNRTALIVLAGAVGLLLLIACANLANLLVARASVRRGEIAVRTSLGASRARIVQQLLTESTLLAIFGGALGIGAAIAGKRLIIVLFAEQLPRLQEVRLSGEVLGFGMALTAFTAFAFGLLPALHCSRMEPQSALRASSRTSSVTEHGRRTREMLVVSEFALTLMLLAGAGLLVNTLYHLSHTDPGFRTNNLLTLRVNLPSAVYATDLQRSSFYRDLLDRLQQLPGVVSAGFTMTMPLQPTGDHSWTMFVRGDRPIPPTPEGLPTVAFAYVTPGYFQALGIPLIRGRAMKERDDLRAPKAAIVSESLARRVFTDEEPVGKTFRLNNLTTATVQTVVGVVNDLKWEDLKQTQPVVYLPLAQVEENMPSSLVLVVHTAANPLTLAPSLRNNIHQLDSDVGIADLESGQDLMSDAAAQPRSNASLFIIFATLALVIAGVGIYGTLSYTVAQRMRELGIRMALGAQRAQVFDMVIRQGMRSAAVGMLIGGLAALGATRSLKSLLFGIKPNDPLTFAIALLVLAAVALAACYFPARRAMSMDPVSVLRSE